MIHLCLGVLVLAALAAGEDEAIRIACGKNRVNVTWRLSRQLAPHGSRFFLGNCIRSHATKLPGGEVELKFDVSFTECKFTKLMKGKHVVFQNKLTYRPQPKSKPAAYEYPFSCVYDRPEAWIPPFLNPGFSATVGRGGLIFRMALLNEQMSGVAKTNVVPLGSFMPIWAAVEQQAHQPLRLFMEECVVADTAVLQPRRQVYPIIGNKGCLTDSVRTNSVFLPRYHSSAIVLYMQTLMLGVGEVYIHCKLVAWDPEVLNESKKACHYSKQNGMWEMLDDPAQSDLCSCCDNTCSPRHRRQAEQDSGLLSQHSVLGPLVIV
ncbi:zona pellucida sperm-binding protein 3-like [Nerophis lumbriciformis]|uniref:zona pellucida sperm-binding protein 3-like n=1 Tax=Nerophis lumbriciformis TaxID=546530 RepID=UPI002AE0A3F3|nr:zona pellucida sperm-binding protein 3-like [Nerophis lumbriciformis]